MKILNKNKIIKIKTIYLYFFLSYVITTRRCFLNKMVSELIIFGTEEIAELAHFYFSRDSHYNVKAFTADDQFIKEETKNNLPIIPYSEIINKFPPSSFHMHIALSYQKLNKLREEKYNRAKANNYYLASYISSKSVYWNDLKYGENCFILENQTIQPKVILGDNVMLWSGNHIGHGVKIGNHTYVSSHVVISGHCEIGERCFLGVNSTLKDFCNIGDDCFVGMSSNLTKDLSNGDVVIAKGSDIYNEDDRRAKALKRSYFKI